MSAYNLSAHLSLSCFLAIASSTARPVTAANHASSSLTCSSRNERGRDGTVTRERRKGRLQLSGARGQCESCTLRARSTLAAPSRRHYVRRETTYRGT